MDCVDCGCSNRNLCIDILFAPDTNTAKGAVHCDSVTQEGQNAYIDMVGMSVKFATYEGYEKLGLHFCEDINGNVYIITLNDSEMSKYQAQNLYWLGITDKQPEAVRITGKAYKFDSEIKEIAVDTLEGSGITIADFANYFGYYYINTNVSATSSKSFIAAVIVLFISIVLLAIGLYNFFAGKNIADDQTHRYGLAIACGVFGLIVASLIPMALGMFLKTISWYAMLAVPFGFFIGYNLIEKEMKLATKILYIFLSTVMGFVSMYVVYVWTYYNGMNEAAVDMSFMQAAESFFDNIDSFKEPFKVRMYLALAPVISLIFSIILASTNKNKQVVQANTAEKANMYVNPEAIDNGGESTKSDAGSMDDNFGYVNPQEDDDQEK
ncbi:MAG: hypothetical protein ACI4EV_00715 [Lachnospiraceae bacterium]